MSHWERFRTGFVIAVIACGVMMLVDMLFVFNIGHIIFSPFFFVPVLVSGYLFAPVIGRFIKYK